LVALGLIGASVLRVVDCASARAFIPQGEIIYQQFVSVTLPLTGDADGEGLVTFEDKFNWLGRQSDIDADRVVTGTDLYSLKWGVRGNDTGMIGWGR